jgi:hypothetical protein
MSEKDTQKQVQGQPHNGDAKQQLPLDLRTVLEMLQRTHRRGPDRSSVFGEFLTSNENNPTKSRVPHPAGMAVYQSLGLWGSTSKTFTYFVQGRLRTFPRNVAGFHDLFKRVIDEDFISHAGKSREEGVTAALGYYLQDIESIQSAQATRLGEKGGASKSK